VTEGRIKDLEVWGVGPEPQPEQGRGTSVLDLDPEVQVMNILYEIESYLKRESVTRFFASDFFMCHEIFDFWFFSKISFPLST
jgi:hypothetical protein